MCAIAYIPISINGYISLFQAAVLLPMFRKACASLEGKPFTVCVHPNLAALEEKILGASQRATHRAQMYLLKKDSEELSSEE
jgi:hypothetical protein